MTTTHLWIGRALSGLAAVFLLFDSTGKVLEVQPVIDGTIALGYPRDLVFTLGVILLAGVLAYVCPRTSVLSQGFLSHVCRRHYVLLHQPHAGGCSNCEQKTRQHQSVHALPGRPPRDSFASPRQKCVSNQHRD